MKDKTNTKTIYNSTIPNDWEVKTINEAFEICNNLRLPINEDNRKKIKGKYPYYGPTKIQGYINEYRLEGTYALIGEDGDHFLKWKELPMTLLVTGKFNVNNHAHIIRGKDNLTEWFFYYFNHKELTPYLTRQGAGRYKLSKNSLGKILCPLPPISEQKSITHILTLMDTIINKNNSLIAKKELQKKWLMQNLLTGKKRFKGFYTEWKSFNLKNICTLIKDGTHGTHVEVENGIPLLSAKDINNGLIQIPLECRKISMEDYNQIHKNYSILKGDIAVTIVGTIGRTAIVQPHNKLFTFQRSVGIFRLNEKAISQYVYHVFSSDKFIHLLNKNANASAQAGVYLGELEKIKIKIPDLEEQTAIAQVLQAADREIQLLKTKTEKLREKKKGIMQLLLTGKKRLTIN